MFAAYVLVPFTIAHCQLISVAFNLAARSKLTDFILFVFTYSKTTSISSFRLLFPSILNFFARFFPDDDEEEELLEDEPADFFLETFATFFPFEPPVPMINLKTFNNNKSIVQTFHFVLLSFVVEVPDSTGREYDQALFTN